MRFKKYLIQGVALLWCATNALAVAPVSAGTPPQDVKQAQQKEVKKGTKPRIQTSARPEDTVFKSAETKTSSATEQKKVETKKNGGETPPPAVKSSSTSSQESVVSKRYIALKTNLAYQAVAVQNLAVEVQCNKHISVELPLIWSFWDMEQEHGIRTFTLQPEARWWTKEAGKGHFVGVHAHVGWFNVKWNDDRYQSTGRPLVGAGLSYGYLLPLSSHWGAEFTLGAGYANMKYDTYYNLENGARIGTDTYNYWGITRVGLSLVYRF